MKGLFWIATSTAIVVSAMVISLCCYGPVLVCAPEPLSMAPALSPNLYQDACVTSVTHPELRIELSRTEKQASGCSLCQYWFRIWNQTSAVGTKAYETRILVVRAPEQQIVLNGKVIQTLKLHGFVTELSPIRYPVLYDEEYFIVQGMCPECLPSGQQYLTLIIEYYECAGIRRFQVVCDLRSQAVRVLQQAFEPTGDCCK